MKLFFRKTLRRRFLWEPNLQNATQGPSNGNKSIQTNNWIKQLKQTIWSNSTVFSGISRFSIYPPGLPNRIKISRIFLKKEKLICLPQYLIIFCNKFPEETKKKRGDSHYVIFFTFKRRRHSTTQVVAFSLTRKYFILRNIILLCVLFFIFWIHSK